MPAARLAIRRAYIQIRVSVHDVRAAAHAQVAAAAGGRREAAGRRGVLRDDGAVVQPARHAQDRHG